MDDIKKLNGLMGNITDYESWQDTIDDDAISPLAKKIMSLNAELRRLQADLAASRERERELRERCKVEAQRNFENGEEKRKYRAMANRLREALEAVEWYSDEDLQVCPWCLAWKKYQGGHAHDCQRQRALGEGE